MHICGLTTYNNFYLVTNMEFLSKYTIDELINELKSRSGVYYEEASSYADPVLDPKYGVIQIYDLREFERDEEAL